MTIRQVTKNSMEQTNTDYYGLNDAFSGLEAVRKAFVHVGRKRRYKKYSYIFMQHDTSRSVYYVENGTVKMSRTNKDGKENIIYIFRSGSLIGLPGAVYGGQRNGDAQALTDCEIYEISNPVFKALLKEHSIFMQRINELLVKRVYYLTERYLSSSVDNAKNRLSFFLAHFYYEQLFKMEQNHLVESEPMRIDQGEIAAAVGMTRQTANELLHELDRDGLIRIHRNTIVFLKAQYFLKTLEV